VAGHLRALLGPDPLLLGIAVAADLLVGDPDYPLHPVRLMGRMLSRVEALLRRVGADGYGGGIALFLILGGFWTAAGAALVMGATAIGGALLARGVHVALAYSLLALGELVRYGGRVEAALARSDLPGARTLVSGLVGRDTDRMDAGACRRAVIESLGENLTDGFVSAVFWYALGGLPGLALFKVVSTMDSMVGYRTPRYLRFGWCGARLDDVLNYLPARLTWLLVAAGAALVPGASVRGALRVGWRQHGLLPSPNSGWGEAAVAGAIGRKLIGPIWKDGALVTDLWLGNPAAAAAESAEDFRRAARVVLVSGVLMAGLTIAILTICR
jgi:adenosylcobinamide-phosphate synthase